MGVGRVVGVSRRAWEGGSALSDVWAVCIVGKDCKVVWIGV